MRADQRAVVADSRPIEFCHMVSGERNAAETDTVLHHERFYFAVYDEACGRETDRTPVNAGCEKSDVTLAAVASVQVTPDDASEAETRGEAVKDFASSPQVRNLATAEMVD